MNSSYCHEHANEETIFPASTMLEAINRGKKAEKLQEKYGKTTAMIITAAEHNKDHIGSMGLMLLSKLQKQTAA